MAHLPCLLTSSSLSQHYQTCYRFAHICYRHHVLISLKSIGYILLQPISRECGQYRKCCCHFSGVKHTCLCCCNHQSLNGLPALINHRKGVWGEEPSPQKTKIRNQRYSRSYTPPSHTHIHALTPMSYEIMISPSLNCCLLKSKILLLQYS